MQRTKPAWIFRGMVAGVLLGGAACSSSSTSGTETKDSGSGPVKDASSRSDAATGAHLDGSASRDTGTATKEAGASDDASSHTEAGSQDDADTTVTHDAGNTHDSGSQHDAAQSKDASSPVDSGAQSDSSTSDGSGVGGGSLDGSGTELFCMGPFDCPTPSNPCIVATCVNSTNNMGTVCSTANAMAGAACGTGSQTCDGSGHCS